MGRIIALVNQKGGVGKTTTAVNLTAALHQAGLKTLLCDFDPQANATSGLGVEKGHTPSSSYDVVINGADAAEAVVHTDFGDLIPSSAALSGAGVELVGTEDREFVLKNALAPLKDSYDVILIDCPPSLELLTLNALCAADSVLIPVQAQYFSMRGLLQLIHTIDKVQRRQNPHLKIEGIVLTLVDNRTNLSRDVSAMLRDAYGANVHIFKTEIPMCVRAAESPSFGKSIFDYDPRGKATLAYEQLAREVLTLGRKKELGRSGFAPTR